MRFASRKMCANQMYVNNTNGLTHSFLRYGFFVEFFSHGWNTGLQTVFHPLTTPKRMANGESGEFNCGRRIWFQYLILTVFILLLHKSIVIIFSFWDEWSNTPFKNDYECKSNCSSLRKKLTIVGSSKCQPSILQLLMSSIFLSTPVAKQTSRQTKHVADIYVITVLQHLFDFLFVFFFREKNALFHFFNNW